ncbi:MAG: hypothetical protein L6M37_00680 [Candidatus Methylarchaceae archaeon HK02M1]|nr:hypothetical protein [Candidatus Methylarchaceae archaeon HK02M1]
MADINSIMKNIPQDSFEEVSEGMVKILLSSKNAEKMPERLTKAILYYFQKDQLMSPEGIKSLLEASMSLEEEKTKDLLQDSGIKIL